MNFSKKKSKQERPEIAVKKRKIGYAERYKYMGDQYDRTGRNMCKIEKKMEKSKFIAGEIRRRTYHVTPTDHKIRHRKTFLGLLE